MPTQPTLLPLQWIVYTPQGSYPCITDAAAYAAMIRQQGGEAALQQWRQLERAMKPLQRGAALFPAAAVRGDLGFALTAARFFGPQMLQMGLIANQLTVRGRCFPWVACGVMSVCCCVL